MGDFIEEDKLFIQKTFISKEKPNPKATAFGKECLANVMKEVKQINNLNDPLRYSELMMIRRTLLTFEDI
jgi:hypothetical protein